MNLRSGRRETNRSSRRVDAFVGTIWGIVFLAFLALVVFVAINVITRANSESFYDLLVKAKMTGGDMPELKIGVRDGLPGIAERQPDGTYKGFDVDVARSIADYLKVPPGKVRFVPIKIDKREEMQGQEEGNFVPVDLVVAAFSITDERKRRGVTFSASYLHTRQAVMTLSDYNGVIQSEGDLRGKRICTLTGSTAQPVLRENDISDIGRHDMKDCIKELQNHGVDAIQSDAAILAGFVAQEPHMFKLHDIGPSESEMWGVHVGRKSAISEARKRLVDAALYHLVVSGEWERLYSKYFGSAQSVVGGDVQVAIGQAPIIPKPEFRE